MADKSTAQDGHQDLVQELTLLALAEERNQMIFGGRDGGEMVRAQDLPCGRAADAIRALLADRARSQEDFWNLANEAADCIDPMTREREAVDFRRIADRAGACGNRLGGPPGEDRVEVPTAVQVEYACRAAVQASGRNPDTMTPRPRGRLGQYALWESYERLIRPALEAALRVTPEPPPHVWPGPRRMDDAPTDGSWIVAQGPEGIATVRWRTASGADNIVARAMAIDGGYWNLFGSAMRLKDPTGWWPLPGAEPAEPEDVWHPVDTAPRDGTKFDAWVVNLDSAGFGHRVSDVQMRGDQSGFGKVMHLRNEVHWEYVERNGEILPAWRIAAWTRIPAGPRIPDISGRPV